MSDQIPGNHILRVMDAEVFKILQPDLRLMSGRRGDILIDQGQAVKMVHFPVHAVLGNVLQLADGSAVETAAVGRDSVSGLAAVFADAPIAWSVKVQVPGELWVMRADRLRQAMDGSPRLRDLLLKVTYDAQCQSALGAACNAEHDAVQRLCKWLLLLLDRTDGNRLAMTQQEIADLLGTERTTINGALQALRDRSAIQASRGRLEIRDRAVVERMACECYQTQRRWTRALGLPVEPDTTGR